MNAPGPWGQFAVVSYVPEPLASFVYDLRGNLPGGHNPRPHLTVLPPRPLPASAEHISASLERVLYAWPPFAVELEEVSLFRETAILYLSVRDGYEELHRLHRALAPLGGPHKEQFPFRPHITLGGPLGSDLEFHLEAARDAWANARCQRRFLVDSFEFLWLEPHAGPADWQCMASYGLVHAPECSSVASAQMS